MIKEAEGATPYGIFLLGEGFNAAASAIGHTRMTTSGPAKLLRYHACELYLKAYLRSRDQSVDTLRSYGHDLAAMFEAAARLGLKPRVRLRRRLEKVTAANDYVRVRYMVVERPEDIHATAVRELADDVRDCVRIALNYDENGTPLLAAADA